MAPDSDHRMEIDSQSSDSEYHGASSSSSSASRTRKGRTITISSSSSSSVGEATPKKKTPEFKNIDCKDTRVVYENGDVRYGSIVPMKHQKELLEWGKKRVIENQEHGIIIADDMGLGKSLETVMLCIELLHSIGKPLNQAKILIVCPMSLLANWYEEICRVVHADLVSLYTGTGSVEQKLERVDRSASFVIVPFSAVQNGEHFFTVKTEWDFCVIDEVHSLRNGVTVNLDNRVSMSMREEKPHANYAQGTRKPMKLFENICRIKATYRIGLTGTPMQNRLSDMCSVCVALHIKGYTSVRDWKVYCGGYNSRTNRWIIDLKDRVFIRRLATEVLDLPEVRTRRRMLRATDQEYLQLSLITKSIKDMQNKLELARLIPNPALRKAATENYSMNILTDISNMRQLACSAEILISHEQKKVEAGQVDRKPILDRWIAVHKSIGKDSTIIRATMEDAKNALFSPNSKCNKMLIFVEFAEFAELLVEKIRSYITEYKGPVLVFTGRVPPPQREEVLKRFNEDPEARIMILTYGVGGVGLNLIESNYSILVDPVYNPQIGKQATKRNHRIGQTRPVRHTYYTLKQTVHEWIYIMQSLKLNETDDVLCDESAVADMDGGTTSGDYKTLSTRIINKESVKDLYTKYVRLQGLDAETMLRETSRRKNRRTARRSKREENPDYKKPPSNSYQRTNGESSDEFEHPDGSDISSSFEEEHANQGGESDKEEEETGKKRARLGIDPIGDKLKQLEELQTVSVFVPVPGTKLKRLNFFAVPKAIAESYKDQPDKLTAYVLHQRMFGKLTPVVNAHNTGVSMNKFTILGTGPAPPPPAKEAPHPSVNDNIRKPKEYVVKDETKKVQEAALEKKRKLDEIAKSATVSVKPFVNPTQVSSTSKPKTSSQVAPMFVVPIPKERWVENTTKTLKQYDFCASLRTAIPDIVNILAVAQPVRMNIINALSELNKKVKAAGMNPNVISMFKREYETALCNRVIDYSLVPADPPKPSNVIAPISLITHAFDTISQPVKKQSTSMLSELASK